MTQEKSLRVIDIEASFEDRAVASLSDTDYAELVAYISAEKPELALSVAQKFFELYLHGNSVDEIHRLNSAFPKSAIQWVRFKYNWDKLKNEHMIKLHESTMQKVMKAQLDATSLIADTLSVASKRHGDKLKKYIQNGNESDLTALDIKSLKDLMKASEALQKITGQDKNQTHFIKKEETLNVNVTTSDENKNYTSETSARILEAIAAEKRKKALTDKEN